MLTQLRALLKGQVVHNCLSAVVREAVTGAVCAVVLQGG